LLDDGDFPTTTHIPPLPPSVIQARQSKKNVQDLQENTSQRMIISSPGRRSWSIDWSDAFCLAEIGEVEIEES
jgi:hypothetical protein